MVKLVPTRHSEQWNTLWRSSGGTLVLSILALTGLLAPTVVLGDITGFVREAGTNAPIAGARVHLQTVVGGVEVLSAADGSFALPVNPPAMVTVAASIAYDLGSASNWETGGVDANNGDVGVVILLDPIPATDNAAYVPLTVGACGGCHPQQVAEWQTSNHSFAGIDTWVLDLFSGNGTPGGGNGYVYTDTHDPGETGFCATCHTPLADVFDPGNVMLDEVVDAAALNGVSCIGCHQIADVSGPVNGLHHLGTSTYRFPEGATDQFVWGPMDDVFIGGMTASYAPFFEESLMCSSCHQYTNPDTGAPGQSTYSEWLASPFAAPGPEMRTCQNCHMPELEAGMNCVIGPEREASQRHSHRFIGATPTSLTDAILLATSAEQVDGVLRVLAEVTNLGAGHNFPTGISIRNAFVVIEATYNGAKLSQTAGSTIPFWADDDLPGQAAGDYAGEPGKGFAKILEGRINGTGPVVRPVLFIDAEGVYSDSQIPSGATDVTEVDFGLVGLPENALVDVQARLIYRRALRAIAVTKGWTETPQGGPIEIEVAAEALQISVTGTDPLEIPAVGYGGLLLLALGMALAALRLLHR